MTFCFPLLFLRPDTKWESVLSESPFRLARRLWETSTFDLATLASTHKLHISYQLMDVMLHRCNLELQIDCNDLEDATDWLSSFLLGLYIQGRSPTIAPFATNYSINEYSGINARDGYQVERLPEGMRTGITSEQSTVEAWPIQLSFSCLTVSDNLEISPEVFTTAASTAKKWRILESRVPTLRVVRDAAQNAPLLPSRDQSLLHIWCALEALFPKVSTEVSFRIALYLSQLQHTSPRREFFNLVRDAYNIRSRVAHGSYRGITEKEWKQSWDLLCWSVVAILKRENLPDENTLLQEILQNVDDSDTVNTNTA